MPIRKLPLLLVNQIAAGEVIERPASVVKELVENSLDAGASRVDVHVEDGGRELIRVSDDGTGITLDDLPMAVAPHATSKLETSEGLAAIDTLGFRGEALASIASVSRLRISSRARIDGTPAEEAWMIEASGEDVGEPEPEAAAPGTVIEVRDLFFNTPARRKFMRAASTEVGHISDIITRIAMGRPDVAFSLTHGQRKNLEAPRTESHRTRAIDLIGKDLAEALLEFEDERRPLAPENAPDALLPRPTRVWGLAGLPSIARATAKHQFVCLNGRPVRDRQLAHAIREAYRGLVPPDRHPVVVLMIDMDPTAVDVNVHPTKAEVRFREPSRIHGQVLSAFRQRLLQADLTPQASIMGPRGAGTGGNSIFAQPVDPAAPEQGRSDDGRGEGYTSDAHDARHAPGQARHPGEGSVVTRTASVNDFVNYFRRMDPTQKTFAWQEVKKALADDDVAASDDAAEPPNGKQPDPNLRIGASRINILQVHQSYIVTQDETGIVIVDQHALHERVMFEELRQRLLGSGKLESQRMLMPATFDADASRMALLEDLAPLLDKLGIEAEPMGPRSIGIHAFPSFLFDRRVDPIEFMEELLDKVDAGDIDVSSDTVEEAALHEVLDMMACKAAVKAGDRMSEDELAALLARRDQIERASNCPHGRPTQIRLTIEQLEKQFGRT